MKWKILIPIIGLCIINISTLFFKASTYSFLDELESYYTIIAVLSFFIITLFSCFKNSYISFKSIDIIIIAILLVSILSYSVSDLDFNNEELILLALGCIFYFFIRISKIPNHYIAIILTFGFIIELCIIINSLIQEVLIPVNLTGSFYNSGPLSGYLVSLVPFFLFTLRKIRNKCLCKFTIYSLFILIIGIIILTQSRASFIALFISISFLISKMDVLSDIKIILKVKYFKILGSILLIILMAGLIYFKINSSIGRLLIWKICLQNSFNGILGYGYGTFHLLYPQWQSNFFMGAKNLQDFESFRLIADITTVCFNEYLQLFLETGLVGLVTFLILIYLVLSRKSSDNFIQVLKSSLISILVFGLFSYPFHIVPIFFVFILCLAIISNLSEEKRIKFRYSTNLNYGAYIMFIIAFLFSFHYFAFHFLYIKKWKYISLYEQHNTSHTLNEYKVLYSKLNNCGPFLFEYGEKLISNQQYKEAIPVLEKCKRIYIKENVYLLLGECYEKNNAFKKAEENYIYHTNMLPNRFKPKYQLLKLYIKTKKQSEAITLAKTILNMPIKIPSDEVFYIKNEAQYFLSHSNLIVH